MRWDGQKVEEDGGQAALPGTGGDVVVRRFDAPEALETRFYEVRAKSALNRVPGGSRVPFNWTINPYRGCSHACLYCADGDTPILLADGRTRRMEDLRAGDRIIGTERDGPHRRYVETEVRDHWSSIKPAFRTVLDDGTELVTSGDHRFLTEGGWKHVVGRGGGPVQRPFLTTGDELLGTGGFATPPQPCADYRWGYLCGMVRGDGPLEVHPRSHEGNVHRFRPALVDDEALARAERYLELAGVTGKASVCAAATGGRRELRGRYANRRAAHDIIDDVVRWPTSPTDGWRKGFLAGIFDAEGSWGGEALRIASTDSTILNWATSCLRWFGFRTVEDPTARESGLVSIRVRGGLREKLRFFHLTDPAITRKRTLQGIALESDATTRVVSVEPLGKAKRLYDITTGTGDYISNGVVSHNCFARPTHEFLDLNAGRDFEKEIVVKVNVPEVLRAELARPSWKRETVALGTNTDPYQWVEGRYKLMRGIWEAMRDFANPCSVLTKSPLVLRDADLLLEIGERTNVSACLSIPTMDERAWRATEPHTPNPRARMEAVAELNRLGIPTGILIAPLMPGINDAPEQVERIIALADEAGATTIGGQTLFLRGSTRDVFMDWLCAQRPDLVELYERLYARGAWAPVAERKRIEAVLRNRARTHPRTAERFFRRAEAPPPRAPAAGPGWESPAQTALF